MIRLESVNTGTAQPIATKSGTSGIYKTARSGAVHVGRLGLLGDTIVDTENHGGPDQAVFIYLSRDYAWWAEELGHSLAPGTLGENLTISGLCGEYLAVGDRLRIGDVLLEITSQRTPCNTLAARMGDRRFVRRYTDALRPGAYCRVLAEGAVTVGDRIEYAPFPGDKVLLTELVDLESARHIETPVLRRCLAAPVHYKLRADLEARLSQQAS